MRSTFFMCVAAVFFITVYCCGDGKEFSEYYVEDGWIKDRDGGVVILRGVQLVYHWPPDYISWHQYDDYARLLKWGFNVIRLGISWAAVEPEMNRYDKQYINAIDERLEWCERLDIKVILDMHQDIYGEKFGGDGAPEWATLDDGIEFERQEPWFINYFSDAVTRAFDNFWTNKEGIQDKFILMWQWVVKKLKYRNSIIGYDLFNEPWCGSFCTIEDTSLFDSDYLYPFYKRLIETLRSEDPHKIIFFEPSIMKNMGVDCQMGKLPFENLVYAPHLYLPSVIYTGRYDGDIEFLSIELSDADKNAKRWGVALFVGEYGYMLGYEPEGGVEYMRDELDLHDTFKVGSIYWVYDRDDGPGILHRDGTEKGVLDVLSRTYPQRIAGIPERFMFDVESAEFELHFSESGAKGQTVIFVPEERHYPMGFVVESSDGEGNFSFDYDEERNLLRIDSDRTKSHHTIRVFPRTE